MAMRLINRAGVFLRHGAWLKYYGYILNMYIGLMFEKAISLKVLNQ
jgi:hypothetical protein